jgi:hypothetical protein
MINPIQNFKYESKFSQFKSGVSMFEVKINPVNVEIYHTLILYKADAEYFKKLATKPRPP